METERRQGMNGIELKLDQILEAVGGLKEDMAASKMDRTSLHEKITEVKNGIDKINGGLRKAQQDVIAIEVGCQAMTQKISFMQKALWSISLVIFSAVITIIIQHVLK